MYLVLGVNFHGLNSSPVIFNWPVINWLRGHTCYSIYLEIPNIMEHCIKKFKYDSWPFGFENKMASLELCRLEWKCLLNSVNHGYTVYLPLCTNGITNFFHLLFCHWFICFIFKSQNLFTIKIVSGYSWK